MNLQANGYECVAAQKSPGQRAWAFKSILEFLKSPSIGKADYRLSQWRGLDEGSGLDVIAVGP